MIHAEGIYFESPVWQFTTESLNFTCTPENKEENVDIYIGLSWNLSNNLSGEITYDVKLGYDKESLPLVASNLSDNYFKPVTLNANKAYFWQIIVKYEGNIYESPLWEFTTEKDVFNGEFSQIILQLPYVWRDYEWVDNDGSARSAGGAGGLFSWTLNQDEWQKNGNTYTGTEISTSNSDFWGHYKKTSTITVTITDSGASASITQITENYDADATVTQTFEFWDLPPIPNDEDYLAAYGTTWEQNLNDEVWGNFTYTYYNIANVDPEGYTREGEYYASGANVFLR